jgi:hypothetical protein
MLTNMDIYACMIYVCMNTCTNIYVNTDMNVNLPAYINIPLIGIKVATNHHYTCLFI